MITLKKHQQEDLERTVDIPRFANLSDPGTGKTLTTLSTWLQRRKANKKLMVFGPRTILESAWGGDIDKLDQGLTYVVPRPGKNKQGCKRTQALLQDVDVYLMNHDAVNVFIENHHGKWRIKPEWRAWLQSIQTIVVDESTAFKHSTSQRSRAMRCLAANVEEFIILTGTFKSGSIESVWHQMYLIDFGERLKPNMAAFRDQTCTPYSNGFGIEWKERPESLDWVQEQIKDIVIRRRREDCLDLPLNVERDVWFTPSTKHMKIYEETLKHCALELDDKVEPLHAIALRTKLLQIMSGAVYTGDGEYSVIDKSRYDMVVELVDETDAAVVAYNWNHQLELISESLRKAKFDFGIINGSVSDKKREETIQRFQAGDLRAILIHPLSGAHGLTLTRGNYTIWASPPNRPEDYQQLNARIDRNGQERPTTTIRIATEGTKEHEVYTSVLGGYRSMLSLLGKIDGSE